MTRSTRRRRRRVFVLLALLPALAVPLAAIAIAGGGADPSFKRDVAPIIADKCAGCHQAGGVAPFPLETARQISSRAELIAAAVQQRIMPPWPPGSRSPAYVGERERTLTADERRTIVSWALQGGRVDGPAGKAPAPAPVTVREGERRIDLRMPKAYRPRAARGATDDYRCFLLDPKLTGDVSVTSTRIEPGTPKVVHHVILFRVAASQVSEAKRLDRADPGLGWTCFGGTGLSSGTSVGMVQDSLNDADWIGAWAPGWGGDRAPEGTGIPLRAGSRIVMQVHYNLLNGRAADRSRTVLTVAPASAGLTPLKTMLLPGPVELACAKSERGPLCDRALAIEDLARKDGPSGALAPAGLLFLCRKTVAKASPVSTCDRRVGAPTTIHVAAGHMHLLGASIRLELNPGTPRARVLLDIPRWDFHWQNAYTLAEPVEARAGDVIRVTCRHDVGKRVRGDEGIPRTPRYVLWGEGTGDEMCLGLLQVTTG